MSASRSRRLCSAPHFMKSLMRHRSHSSRCALVPGDADPQSLGADFESAPRWGDALVRGEEEGQVVTDGEETCKGFPGTSQGCLAPDEVSDVDQDVEALVPHQPSAFPSDVDAGGPRYGAAKGESDVQVAPAVESDTKEGQGERVSAQLTVGPQDIHIPYVGPPWPCSKRHLLRFTTDGRR